MSEHRTDDRPAKASLAHRLYHGETAFDFVGKRRIWFLVSALVIAAGLVSLLTQGLNYGIEFEGGTSWEVDAPGVSVGEARDAVRPFGLADATIQTIGGDRIRVAGDNLPPEEQQQVTQALAELARADASQVSVQDVGPSWGQAVTDKARNALVVFFVLISIYISLRFEWKMAVAALAAVVHDIFVTVGVYSLTGREVTASTVAAFLTILGYSIYDTIIIFDRVRENIPLMRKSSVSAIANQSLWETIRRSLATTFITLLPVATLLFFGGETLKDFAFAILIGVGSGAYSTIFIATPLLMLLKEREPEYAKRKAAGLQEKVELLEEPSPTPAPALVSAPEPAAVEGDGGAAGDGAAAARREARRKRRRARPHGRAR
jgi:preprotein translocase SecF subunit